MKLFNFFYPTEIFPPLCTAITRQKSFTLYCDCKIIKTLEDMDILNK